jgi:hypothetical protein
MYDPQLPELAIVRTRISAESWEARVQHARDASVALDRIVARVDAGETLNRAIAAEVPKSRRSWVMRNWTSYRRIGFEALIDTRVPREPREAKRYAVIIETAREANPEVTVEDVLRILKRRKANPLPSVRTIKKHFARVDARQRYTAKKAQRALKVEELAFAGGELLLAAEAETGVMAALTDEIEAIGAEVRDASAPSSSAIDDADRDRRGRFTKTYNRKRRRKKGEEIASYLRPAEAKAAERDLSVLRFVQEQRKTLDAKVRMLTFAPLVSTTAGWDALRSPDAAGLQPLVGFAYMPSTLAKFTSALALTGAGPRLLETVGTHWHQVAESRWGEGGAMAALYVDNHAKEVWSSLYMLSGKVSHLNRVMPCITTTYIHTGAGTPLVASVQSGSAPLAPRLLQLVEDAEQTLGGDVRRAVIIDAEGSTFDILESFQKRGRIIVTPLRPSRAPGLELSFTPGSYYRPYREHDEMRVASAHLVHKSSGRSIDVGALLVRRAHRENDSILLTTGLDLGMDGRSLADLYYARWPLQENAFKDGAAVGIAEHRGKSGRMIANIAVVTELEKLQARAEKNRETQSKLHAKTAQRQEAVARTEREHAHATRALATRRRRLDTLIADGREEGRQLGRAAVEHQDALATTEKTERKAKKARAVAEAHARKLDRAENEIAKAEAQMSKLEPRRKIRQLDVALDSILTAAKLTASLLISFVLREYLPDMAMTPNTFVSRIFNLKGRREIVEHIEERVIFYDNPRDPEATAAIAQACARLNQRRLYREDRRLRYSIEPPPVE